MNKELVWVRDARRAALAVFALACMAAAGILWQLERIAVHNERIQVSDLAGDYARVLEHNVERALSAANVLAALLRQGGGRVADFDAMAAQMLPSYPGVAALGLAPQGVMRRIYPLAGNESALGHDLLRDPARARESALARDTRRLTLAGPFQLVQGGLGAVGRLPVFLDEKPDGQKFWGFVVVLLRFPDVLGADRLAELAAHGLGYKLWRIHPDSGKPQVIAQQAAGELTDAVERGIEVPNAIWTLSVAPLRGWIDPVRRAGAGALALLFCLLLAYLAKVMVELKGHKRDLEKVVARRTAEILVSQHRLRAALDAIPDLVWLKDESGAYLDCNPVVERHFGMKKPDIIGKTDFDLIDKETAERFREHDRETVAAGKPVVREALLADGVYETIKTPMLDSDGKLISVLGISRNISERKLAEAKIQRLSNLYAALSQCNQAILRCTSAQELFPKICRDVVQYGGVKLAWIGIVEPETGRVLPVAMHGEHADYLDGLLVSIDPSTPAGGGVTGTAIRNREPVWCQDYQHDPLSANWRGRDPHFGWGGAAALPLYQDGAAIGAFVLYAGEKDAFDEAARKLLVEMADNISFGITAFTHEAERRSAEALVRLAARVFEQSNDSFVITDPNLKIVLVNHAFTVMTGYSEQEAMGRDVRSLAAPRHGREFFRAMWKAVVEDGHWQGEMWNRRKDGTEYPQWLSVSRMLDESGKLTHVIGISSDLTQHKAAQEYIEHLANFDPLTGLANRKLLKERIELALGQAARSHGSMALLLLDIDHFKNVNDSLGHGCGDELLTELARRLASAAGPDVFLARSGGDEFVLALPQADAAAAAHLAGRLLEDVAQPYRIGGYELVVTPSIGVAMYPNDGEDFDSLSKCADIAMYRAKRDGRNNFRFFTSEMQVRSMRTLTLENALRRALERAEFSLHYQPQFALSDNRVVGAEALLRWHTPELGPVSPAEFIPVAEDTGLILPIGEWVLRTAAQQAKMWMETGMAPITIAVNLSSVQFRHPNLPALVTQILHEERLEARFLELELTESVAMDNPREAIEIIDDLHQRGVRLSIDDFGTGYSSLSYLKRFQVHKLKIDQSFVRDITVDPDDMAIVGAIIGLAASLGVQTIAEGVETAGQLEFLRARGCNEAQGYYFSKPLPPAEFEAFMRAAR